MRRKHDTAARTRVENDNRVCAGKVDAQAARARGEQEDEAAAVWLVEARDCRLARAGKHASVHALVGVDSKAVAAEVFKHVQHAHHLAEDKHAVASRLQLRQHRIQQRKLARRRNTQHRGGGGVGGALGRLCAVE